NPIAAKTKLGESRGKPDNVTAKLAALQYYQLSLPAPAPPEGSFDSAAAQRGEQLFTTKAKCATCHVPPLFTEPGWNLHTPQEIGVDDFQAKRSPGEQSYRTAPLHGLFAHSKGGFYHDGRFSTLADVVEHYNNHLHLQLSATEKTDLVEYLKSLQKVAEDTVDAHPLPGNGWGETFGELIFVQIFLGNVIFRTFSGSYLALVGVASILYAAHRLGFRVLSFLQQLFHALRIVIFPA